MLQAMRSGVHSGIIKAIFFGILILGVGGLVFSDIGGVFRGGVSSTDVARVGGKPVSLRSFDRTVRMVLHNQGMDPDMAYRLGYIDRILYSEIYDNLITMAAREKGIIVSEKQVAEQISRLIQPQLDGNTTPQQALERILASQGITEASFINSVRQEMANTILRNAFQSGASFVPEKLALDLYLYDNEKREIEYFLVSEKDFTGIEKPGEKELKEFYEVVKEQYAIPEKRTLAIAKVNPEEIESTIGITEEELRQIYQENIDYYTLPEKREMAQAIVPSQKTALDIYEKADAGKPLQTSVIEVTGSGDAFVDVNTFEKGELPEQVAKAAFSLENEGDVSKPVETPLGWHVIKVTEIKEPRKMPFEEVEEEIRAEQMQYVLANQMLELAGSIDDMLAGGASFKETVEAFDLLTEKYGPLDKSAKDEEGQDLLEEYGEDRATIIDIGFSLMEGEISPVTELRNGAYIFVRTDKVTPRTWEPYDEVKDDLVKKWVSRQQKIRVMETAGEALAALQEGGSFREVAGKYGGDVKTAVLKRSREPGEIFNVQVIRKFFELEKNEAGSAATKNAQIIGRITGINLPDPKDVNEEDTSKYRQTLKRMMPNEIMQSYLDAQTEKYGVKINRKLLDRAYGNKDGG
jgi:peptidyl-prolyl cis-trans isomerase D